MKVYNVLAVKSDLFPQSIFPANSSDYQKQSVIM